LQLDWRADTLRKTDRKSVDRIVDKQAWIEVPRVGKRETPT